MKDYSISKKMPRNNKFLGKYPKMTSQLLFNKKIKSISEAEKFLNPKWEDNYNPFLLDDMEKSIKKFYEAIRENKKITIYADYDADGIPGASILSKLFNKISYENYDVYIPHRQKEGYGINIESLKEIKKNNTKLIISIDLGITEYDAGKWCKSNNVDLIITDHHLPLKNKNNKERLPKAYSIINPKKEICNYPDKMICGAGVIFKFIQAFIKRYGKEFNIDKNWEKWLLDMVGIATISDMVPLVNENRLFAYFGMKVIKKINQNGINSNLGLKNLIQNSDIHPQYITEEDIAFGITPKINAASRMSHPKEALELFIRKDNKSPQLAIENIIYLNNKRKELTKKITDQAIKKLSQKEIKDIIVIGDDKWNIGVLGLVASKLVEKYKLPVFIWSKENNIIKGSCRSINKINLVEIMSETENDTFINFGGHSEAGGFSCDISYSDKLEKKLVKAFLKIKKKYSDIKKENIEIDMELSIDDVSIENYNEIRKLAPFGIGNEKPLFIFKNVLIDKVGTFGKDKNHLEIFFKNSLGKTIRGISFFKIPSDFKKLKKNNICNIIANLEYSVFRGKHELRLRVIDIV